MGKQLFIVVNECRSTVRSIFHVCAASEKFHTNELKLLSTKQLNMLIWECS